MARLTVNGFSLVELLIIAAIIGILTAVAMPACERRKQQGYKGKEVAKCVSGKLYVLMGDVYVTTDPPKECLK